MWRKYRRFVETLQALILSGLPFLTLNGHSVLRFDIQELKLYFFGSVIWIREFYLFLAAILFFLLLITFVTAIFGRIWCGWLCPQTVLLDLTQSIARRFRKVPAASMQKLLLIPFSALVSFSLVSYFVPPLEVMSSLFVSVPVTGFFLVIWVTAWLQLAVLGRGFCSSICPYAVMQNALFDSETLVIEYDVSRDDTCMKCDDCVRACPVGIDIKKGLSTKCIACAECIDACLIKSSRRNMPPFPAYRGTVLRPKTFWLGGATVAAGLFFLILVFTRPAFDVIITRNQEALPEKLNRFSYSIYNNTTNRITLEMTVSPGFTIIGEHSIHLEPSAVMQGRILVRKTGGGNSLRFTLTSGNVVVKQETGFL